MLEFKILYNTKCRQITVSVSCKTSSVHKIFAIDMHTTFGKLEVLGKEGGCLTNANKEKKNVYDI